MLIFCYFATSSNDCLCLTVIPLIYKICDGESMPNSNRLVLKSLFAKKIENTQNSCTILPLIVIGLFGGRSTILQRFSYLNKRRFYQVEEYAQWCMVWVGLEGT